MLVQRDRTAPSSPWCGDRDAFTWRERSERLRRPGSTRGTTPTSSASSAVPLYGHSPLGPDDPDEYGMSPGGMSAGGGS